MPFQGKKTSPPLPNFPPPLPVLNKWTLPLCHASKYHGLAGVQMHLKHCYDFKALMTQLPPAWRDFKPCSDCNSHVTHPWLLQSKTTWRHVARYEARASHLDLTVKLSIICDCVALDIIDDVICIYTMWREKHVYFPHMNCRGQGSLLWRHSSDTHFPRSLSLWRSWDVLACDVTAWRIALDLKLTST